MRHGFHELTRTKKQKEHHAKVVKIAKNEMIWEAFPNSSPFSGTKPALRKVLSLFLSVLQSCKSSHFRQTIHSAQFGPQQSQRFFQLPGLVFGFLSAFGLRVSDFNRKSVIYSVFGNDCAHPRDVKMLPLLGFRVRKLVYWSENGKIFSILQFSDPKSG